MNQTTFYTEEDPFKILNLLESLLLEEKDVIVMQQDESGEKYLHSCRLAYYSGMKKYLKIKSNGGEIKLKGDASVYIHSNDFDLVFKANNLNVTQTALEMDIPKFVKVKEHRKKGRFTFPRTEVDDQITSYIIPDLGLDGLIEGAYKVLDLSLNGIGIYMPVEKANLLKEGDKVVFKRILICNLEETLVAVVRNKKEIFPSCRVGFEFESEFNSFDFQSIISLYA